MCVREKDKTDFLPPLSKQACIPSPGFGVQGLLVMMTLLGKDTFVLNLGNSLGLEKDNPQVGFFNNFVGDNSPPF